MAYAIVSDMFVVLSNSKKFKKNRVSDLTFYSRPREAGCIYLDLYATSHGDFMKGFFMRCFNCKSFCSCDCPYNSQLTSSHICEEFLPWSDNEIPYTALVEYGFFSSLDVENVPSLVVENDDVGQVDP